MGTQFPKAYESTLPEDPKKQIRLIGRAWERFVASGEISAPAPRSVIVKRWLEARDLGVDPEAERTPTVLEPEQITELLAKEALGQAGAQALDCFSQMVSDSGHLIVLADVEGRILYSAGQRDVQRRLAEVNFKPGGLWAETVAGPNGLGTPLALGTPEVVFGTEHYCQGWQPWVCYGAPVKDPGTGSLMGAVDITGPATKARGEMMAMTVSVARYVEQLLALSELKRRDFLRSARMEFERRWPQEGILLINERGRIVEYNTVADRMLDLHSRGVAGHPVTDVLPGIWPALPRSGSEAQLTLAAGRREEKTLRLRVLPVDGDGGHVGFALVLSGARVIDAGAYGRERLRPTGPRARFSFAEILGESVRLRDALDLASAAAKDRRAIPVLITGESGTGKEMVAHAVHGESARGDGPFVAVNCGALPRDLVESELFGYASGAFTGARREGQAGKFEAAHGGTLFLDEIDSMPGDVQAKLLRVLEDREVTRLGSTMPIPVDVRVIAAASSDLRRRIEEGAFRLDLFYRLSVVEVMLPALRERGQDVLMLAHAFLEQECEEAGKPAPGWSDEAVERLLDYHWPGNVRELRNLCRRLALTTKGPLVDEDELPAPVRQAGTPSAEPAGRGGELRELSDELIRRTLLETGGRIGETARRLGISRTTIYRRRKRWSSG